MDRSGAIRVLVVDDHPAVRAGIWALVDAEPGLEAAGAVADAFAVPPALHALRPDVVVVDYQLRGTNGLSLCRTITRGAFSPAVLVYTAFAHEDMVVAAHLAGAGAILDKSDEPRRLGRTIRRLAAGETLLPPLTPRLLQAAGHRVAVEDLPLIGMLTNGVGPDAAASALDVPADDLETRIGRVLSRLVPGPRRG